MNILIHIIILSLLFLTISAFIVLFFAFMLDSLLKGHDLPTSKRATKSIIKIISQYKLDTGVFYDLGCGRGTLTLYIKKGLSRLKVYGIDNSAIRIFFAKLKSKLLKRKIKFKKQDIFQTNLKNADVVYTYLWYDLMPPLEKKIQKELKQGAMVITNTSHFSNWKPIKKLTTYPKKSQTPNFETLFVYIKK